MIPFNVQPFRRGHSHFLSGYKSQVNFPAAYEVAHMCVKIRMRPKFAL